MSQVPADDLSYEQALAELDGIIRRLERGDVDLDGAIAAYERGVQLEQRCARLLEASEHKVRQLVAGPRGLEERPLEERVPEASPAPSAAAGRTDGPLPTPAAAPPAGPDDDIPF